MLSPRIETDRLVLRRYIENDIDGIYDLITDKRLHTYISFPDLTRYQELDYIKECMKKADDDELEKWSITLKNNKTIGNISVNTVNKKHNYCVVGYVIDHENQGNGYASEALELVSNYLLEKYYLVECTCNENNVGSYRVMEKAGFKRDGLIPNKRLNKDGSYSGVLYYSKVKEKK